MTQKRLIGLMYTYSMGICRAILHGIKRYAQDKPDWVFFPVPPRARGISDLKAMRPDGVIAHVLNAQLSSGLKRLRLPVVNTCGLAPNLPFPRVGIDSRTVGRLAAEHLAGLGLDHFGFVGHPRLSASMDRHLGFREALRALNYDPPAMLAPGRTAFDPNAQAPIFGAQAKRWLQELPKPAGIFVANDIWAIQLTELCRQLKLRVPEDLAILGVDNDAFLCELSRPALSSVELPGERMGFEAAAMLNDLLSGKKVSMQPLLLPPTGIMTRPSTDLLAVKDSEVAAALRFIRDPKHPAIRVSDVLARVNISRRSLERRFKFTLGRGLWEEIRRVKIERTKNLLTHTDTPMPGIAAQVGFSNAKQLATVFREVTGQTPTEFRRTTRVDGIWR